jgi:hypothetical protein
VSLSGSPGRDGASDGADASEPTSTPPPPPAPTTTRLTGLEAAKLHITLAAGLALCAVAFWFEVRRALGGNELSWAYVFEWPLLAVFALYMWWQTLHLNRRKQRAAPKPKVVAPEHVEMLRNWQLHLQELAEAEAKEKSRAEQADPGADP